MSKSRKKPIIYFDANATTLICDKSRKEMDHWAKCYNASSDSRIAKPVKQLIEDASDTILKHCKVNSSTHTVIFTSGATESNCFIIKACARAYRKKLIERGSELRPHVIISALEHHSIMECVKDLLIDSYIEVSYVTPTIYGNILPSDVEKEIKPNTCLISIMYANNEIPVINNIREIGRIAHEKRIPMHSDCVQIFGKYQINMKADNIDALSASAHKFYGPKGVGLLIISNALIEGYAITAEISGSQQHSLRGGTENVPGIAAMLAALQHTFVKRHDKNVKLFALRNRLLESLAKIYEFDPYDKYLHGDVTEEEPCIKLVSLGPPSDKTNFILPNTILLAICKAEGRPFCNVKLKKYLDDNNIIVSIGSACLTSNEHASHVLTSIGAPPIIKRGVIRISFSDYNTVGEIDAFISAFKAGVEKQMKEK